MSEEPNNLKVWDAVCRPPTTALKQIKGGRLTGKSDINPQWRIKAMTEQFGPCGVGWKFAIDRLWIEPGVEGVVFAFAQVSVYTMNPEAPLGTLSPRDGAWWSAPIPGVGGHKLIESEKGGLYCNDEAYKMCVTDALGTALKMLGVAADIYLGNFDGSKYLTPPDEEVRKRDKESKQARENARSTGLAILKVAAEKGVDALKLAWSTLAEAHRVACKDDKEELKQYAAAVDARKDGAGAASR